MADALAISDLRATDGRPLADNLAAHLRARIEDGRLRAADRLPTIRELALQAGTTEAELTPGKFAQELAAKFEARRAPQAGQAKSGPAARSATTIKLSGSRST